MIDRLNTGETVTGLDFASWYKNWHPGLIQPFEMFIREYLGRSTFLESQLRIDPFIGTHDVQDVAEDCLRKATSPLIVPATVEGGRASQKSRVDSIGSSSPETPYFMRATLQESPTPNTQH